MRFTPQDIPGLCLVDLEPREDERGYFARSFCAEEFAGRGLAASMPQCSVSYNRRRHSLRGMHFQRAPHAEAKLIRVTRGALWDVALDLRRDSPTYLQWRGFELRAGDGRQVYIPEGCAHGFQTLEDDTEVYYMISVPYDAGASAGARWDDPAFAIRWPDAPERILAPRDLSFPPWVP
jgi:dTDP-4-dehydrorhamnose 3,5-epimerase